MCLIYCMNIPLSLTSFFFNTCASFADLFSPIPCCDIMFYLYILPPDQFNVTLFSLPLCPTSLQFLMLVVLSLWGQTHSKAEKGYEMNWLIMNSTFITLPLYTILVSILCPCQDVIAEDTREGLPSCPSEPTMVTCIYSCGALRICKHATSPSLSACWPDA